MVPVAALPGFILPSWTVNWADFSTRLLPHTATELACGLVPPVALLAGFVCADELSSGESSGNSACSSWSCSSRCCRARVFRWSFRWLPFLHVILALLLPKHCDSSDLGKTVLPKRARGQTKRGSRRLLRRVAWTCVGRPGHRGVLGISHTGRARLSICLDYARDGRGLGDLWKEPDCGSGRRLSSPSHRCWPPYVCLPPNCGVPKYNLAQELTKPAPLDPERLYLSVYPAPEFAYRVENKPEPFGTTSASRQHLHVGRRPFAQRLQPDPAVRRGQGVSFCDSRARFVPT